VQTEKLKSKHRKKHFQKKSRFAGTTKNTIRKKDSYDALFFLRFALRNSKKS